MVVDAPFDDVARRVRRNVGRLEPIDDDHTRLVGTHRRALVVRRAPRASSAHRSTWSARRSCATPYATSGSCCWRPRTADPSDSAPIPALHRQVHRQSRFLCTPRHVAAHPMHRFATLAGDFRVRVVRRRSARSSVARELGHKSSSRQSEVRKMSGGGIFSGLSGRSGSSAQEMPPLTRPPAPATSPGDQDRVSEPIPFDRPRSSEPTTDPTALDHDRRHQRHRPRRRRGRARPDRPADARTCPSPGRSPSTATRG